MRSGKSVEEIIKITKPIEEQITEILINVYDDLKEVHSRVISEGISSQLAESIEPNTNKIKRLAENLFVEVNKIANS